MTEEKPTLAQKLIANQMAHLVLHGDKPYPDGGASITELLREHLAAITPMVLKEPIQYEVQTMTDSDLPTSRERGTLVTELPKEIPELVAVSGFTPSKPWPDPTPEQLASPWFNTIWNVIKTWDINVPEVYEGYCGATGNHVVAILNALVPNDSEGVSVDNSNYDFEQWR